MKDPNSGLIEAVSPASPAAKAGIRPGWRLAGIDGKPIGDILDYRIAEADSSLELSLLDLQGKKRLIRVSKPYREPLGLKFASPSIEPVQRCGNRCIFCFVDQNPPGLRSSLYLKDDDYRLSFLYGNFITLNRLKAAELKRIVKLGLSPLYVSVHSTNPALRSKLFGTDRAARGLRNLRLLAHAGIKFHAQIVIIPGLNSGRELKRTVMDLYSLGDSVTDIALVPVGLTDHRRGREPLRRPTDREAKTLIEQVSRWQEVFLRKKGTRYIFLADEFYLQAGLPLPVEEEYEGYPQLENGVGQGRIFLNELDTLRKPRQEESPGPARYTIITGRASAPLLYQLKERLSCLLPTVDLNVVVAENSLFGSSVTVTGLLSGADLIRALQDRKTGEAVFVPEVMFKEGTDLFLDNLTKGDVQEALSARIIRAGGPQQLYEAILSERKKSPVKPAAEEK